MAEIELPNNWQPRWYQRKLWAHLEGGGKRAIAIWHRRAGKDDVVLHRTAVAAHERIGNYWHMLPEASQARKAIWEAINPHTGKPRIDEAFPVALRSNTRSNEMSIRFKCGSTWQVVGSDNYNSLVGAPPVGIVFSEFALADPAAWAYLRPILRENGGWAVFITTPRGRNHAATFFESAKDDPEWFAEHLPATETDVFTPHQLEVERAEYIREFGPDDGDARFRQEYLCSFSAGVIGAYYGNALERLEGEDRIGSVPWTPTLPVHCGWDLGRRDTTAVWFFQLVGQDIHFVDYLENNGVHISWYAKELDKKPYKYGQMCLPADAESEFLPAPQTTAGQLRGLGFKTTVLEACENVDQEINAVRTILPRSRFDKEKCARGLEGLRNYRRAWDDKRKCYNDHPLHDWASHPADGFRSAGVAIVNGLRNPGAPKKITYPRVRTLA